MFLTVKRFRQDSKVSQSPAKATSETFSNDLHSSASSLDYYSSLTNDPFQQKAGLNRVEVSNHRSPPVAERCTNAKNTTADTSNSALARLNFNTHTLFAFRVSSISQAHTCSLIASPVPLKTTSTAIILKITSMRMMIPPTQ